MTLAQSLTARVPALHTHLYRLLQLVCVANISIYVALWLHHHYITSHVKTPSLNVPYTYIAPLLMRAAFRSNTTTLTTTEAQSWLNSIQFRCVMLTMFSLMGVETLLNRCPRASIFCYVYKMDNVCIATEMRYYLTGLYNLIIGIMSLSLVVATIYYNVQSGDSSIWRKSIEQLETMPSRKPVDEQDKKED